MATGQIATPTWATNEQSSAVAPKPREGASSRQPSFWDPTLVVCSQSADRPEWNLDERTRNRGRRGVAQARLALLHQVPEQLELELAAD